MKKEEVAICLMIDAYLSPMLDIEITYDEIQNILFLMQETGEELELKFEIKQNFPYSDNVEKILDEMIQKNMIKIFDNNESRSIDFCENTLYQAYNIFKTFNQTTKDNFKKTEKLMFGFETPYGLRLLSAVYILKYIKNKDINEICNRTKFIREQVQTAIAHLNRFF